MKTWQIEYEIPPLRAIYFARCDADTKAEVAAAVKEQCPNWKARKISPMKKTKTKKEK